MNYIYIFNYYFDDFNLHFTFLFYFRKANLNLHERVCQFKTSGKRSNEEQSGAGSKRRKIDIPITGFYLNFTLNYIYIYFLEIFEYIFYKYTLFL